METKELKIQIPKGYCIDESKSTFEKIVFKEKDTKPRSWEEYCENHKGSYYFISGYEGKVLGITYPSNELVKFHHPEKSKHILPTKELAEAFLAMMQLMSLRQSWIGDWKPYLNKSNWCIAANNGRFASVSVNFAHPLSFPTEEMAEDFMNCFKDLLEIAKPLI